LLSESLSPAPGPWGIPFELELDALELDGFDVVFAAAGELWVVVGAAGALFVGVAVLVAAAGELFVEEEEEPELPQPAAMTAATASATSGSPRATLNLLIMANLCLFREPAWQGPLVNEDDGRTPTNLPYCGEGKVLSRGQRLR
jgi:hypothetical protein